MKTQQAPGSNETNFQDTLSGSYLGRERYNKWTEEEHERFMEGLRKFGNSWKKVAAFVKTRTCAQIRSHCQKYYRDIQREAIKKAKENNRKGKDLFVVYNAYRNVVNEGKRLHRIYCEANTKKFKETNHSTKGCNESEMMCTNLVKLIDDKSFQKLNPITDDLPYDPFLNIDIPLMEPNIHEDFKFLEKEFYPQDSPIKQYEPYSEDYDCNEERTITTKINYDYILS